jgi:cystathionine gamma-lyase
MGFIETDLQRFVRRYLNGHSDVVMGMVLTNSDEIKTRLRFLQNGIGAVPSPFDCFLAMRGMKTLHLRMREHAKNALHIAQFLEAHPKATTPPACHGSVLVCRP